MLFHSLKRLPSLLAGLAPISIDRILDAAARDGGTAANDPTNRAKETTP